MPPQSALSVPETGSRRDRLARLLLAGPGLLFTLTVVGPRDLVSNAAAGAQYGYALLWAVALSLIFRYFWVSAAARYVLVTGESLLTGYARLGNWVIWAVLGTILLHRHTSNLYLMMMLGASADLLYHLPSPHSTSIWGICFVCAASAVMFRARFKRLEMVFRVIAGILGVAFAAAAVLSKPDLGVAFRAILTPRLPESTGLYGTFFMLSALIGTGAGTMSNISYAYFIHRKGWTDASHLRKQKADLLLSILCIFLLCALIQVAAAGTLWGMGGQLRSAEDLARILSDHIGPWGVIIFALGLWSVSLTVFVGSTTGFALIVTDICRNLIPALRNVGGPASAHPNPEQDGIYRASVAFCVLTPLYIFFTGVQPVWLVLFVSSVTVALIPFLIWGLLRITNDRVRLGRHANGWITNTALVTLLATSLVLVCKNVFDYFASL